ncbi:MAG: hypothetical protein HYY62_02775 [Deltaproteobacteria bacterium]|nr:hypothetical protein [Deltaproteobacteria bacterium]
MKKVTLTILTGIMILTSVHAMARVLRPGEERAIKGAQMTKIQSTGSFVSAESVSLTLTKKDNSKIPTGLFLNYLNTANGEIRTVHLPIVERRSIGGGSVEYVAHLVLPNGDKDRRTSLPEEEDRENLPPYYMERSLSVILTDHTRRLLTDLPANLWEARVVESEGFCLVSTMELEGHPETIYTIQ